MTTQNATAVDSNTLSLSSTNTQVITREQLEQMKAKCETQLAEINGHLATLDNA